MQKEKIEVIIFFIVEILFVSISAWRMIHTPIKKVSIDEKGEVNNHGI